MMNDRTIAEDIVLLEKPQKLPFPPQGSPEYAVEKAKIALGYITDFLEEGDVESALQMAMNIRLDYDA